MSKAAKALAKILSGTSDKNVSFDEAVYVLTKAGFVLDGGKGSHQVYRHANGKMIVLPKHGKKIKPIYVKLIRKLLT